MTSVGRARSPTPLSSPQRNFDETLVGLLGHSNTHAPITLPAPGTPPSRGSRNKTHHLSGLVVLKVQDYSVRAIIICDRNPLPHDNIITHA